MPDGRFRLNSTAPCCSGLILLVLAACSPLVPVVTTDPARTAPRETFTAGIPTPPPKVETPRVATLSSSYPTQTPRAGWPPGRIVFTCQAYSREQAGEQICMIDADDPGTVRTMTYGAQHYYGSLAPEGMSLIYSGFREKDVYEIYELGWREGTPASSQFRQLTDRLGVLNAAEVSPDGRQIVFARHVPETGLDEIWLMQRDGRDQRRLLDMRAWDPTWSPDGREILFASDQAEGIQLWVVEVDGSNLRRVTDLPAQRGRSDWSPDGRSIVTDSGGPWRHEIYLMNADGSDAHRISPPGGNSQGPTFSPDGQWVAFTAYFDHPNDPNGCEIYIMRIDGTDRRRMTDNLFCDYQPRWGP